ncbi:unnamed protein product [Linum tenue]|uniref:Uncharacterized protein n=1 Tax=Linum tenue TaxID=586396 RepID=A0AAV0JBB7_9ROSI|nr:unnamed protein product [Linum tenue]
MASCHVRSVSLPSQASHPPAFSIIQQQLHDLKTAPQSAGSLRHNIINLKALSRCIDDLLQTQLSEQRSSPEPATRLAVETLLDASIKLLDMCSSVRDIISRMKQSMRDLESSLRRIRSDYSSQVDGYLVCRKGLGRLACKNIKIMEKSRWNYMSSEEEEKSSNMVGDLVSLLRGVEEICVAEFRAILCFVSAPRKPHYSVVSKLMHSKREVVEKGETRTATVVEKIDAEMFAIKSSKFVNAEQIGRLLRGLEGFGSSLDEAENGLEGLFRRLLRSRVLLLNILSN